MKRSEVGKKNHEKNDEVVASQRENVKKLEKELVMLKKSIEKYSGKLSKSKKRNDNIGKSIRKLFEGEKGEVKETLQQFSEILFNVGKYQEEHVDKIYEKVIGELSLSRCRCKQATFNIDLALKHQKDETRKEKQVNKIKESVPFDKQKLAKAQQSLLASAIEAEKAFTCLEEELETFEQQRVDELRAILLAFTESELMYHSHALELYTKAFNVLRQCGRPQSSSLLDAVGDSRASVDSKWNDCHPKLRNSVVYNRQMRISSQQMYLC